MAPFKHREKSGFTLLEVMVAIAVIAVAMSAIYRLEIQSLAMADDGKYFITAPLLAGKVIAELEMKTSEEVENESGDFGENFPGASYSIVVEDVESEILEAAAQDLKRIDIDVFMNNGDYKYSTRIYRLFPNEKK